MTVKEYLELDKKCPWYSKDYTSEEEREADKEKIREYNKSLIEKYPWLLPRNRWTDKVVDDYDYDFTELDSLPDGWRIAFGEQMCDEIQNELVKYNYVDKYRITQIKEKFGYLHWYDFGATDSMYNIIHKYEHLSEKICIRCGKPAEWMTTDWISPYCDNCKSEIENEVYDKFVTVKEWFKEDD